MCNNTKIFVKFFNVLKKLKKQTCKNHAVFPINVRRTHNKANNLHEY